MLKKISLDSTIVDMLAKFNNSYIFIGDFTTNQFQWSKNAVVQFPLSGEFTEDKDIWEKLIVEEDRKFFKEALGELMSGGKGQVQGEYHMHTRTGGTIPVQFHLSRMPIDSETEYYAGTISSLIAHNSLDPLTGLRNIYDFRESLTAIARHQEPLGLLVIGIDDFKQINDLHSYTVGDEVLSQCASILECTSTGQGNLFRLDGDSFGFLYAGADKGALASSFVKFQESLMVPLQIQGMKVPITVSGAGCVYPDDSQTGEGLFRCARIALNVAKNNGGSQFVSYSKEIATKIKREMLLLEKLRESVKRKFSGFHLNYQPLVYNSTGKLFGCEVLLRWSHPDFPDGVMPLEFIPILENTGLIIKVGEWVVRNAVKQCAKWVRLMPDFQMSINATCAQFEDPEFRFFVMDCLCRERLSPNLITLELTESNKIKDTDAVSYAFDFFRAQGIKIAFDDFGMGYASLDIFRLLSADELKIDKSFLERLSYDVTDRKIIEHLISLCNSMNMYVCVEGVETAEVHDIVQQLGPTLLQGYLYNKPMSADAFEEYYFKNNRHLIETVEIPTKETSPDIDKLTREKTMVYSPLKPVQALKMEELVDSAYAGIFQVGLDYEFTFLTCNEGYRRMLGYTAKQMEEKFKNQALGFVHPDDMQFVNDEIRRQLGVGDVISSEFRVVRADGTAIWVVGSGNIVRGKNGSPSLSVVIINNDAAKKRTMEMEKQCKTYKRILERMPMGMKCVRYDEDFTLDYISPAFLSLLGYNESELQSKFQNKFINLIYEEDRAQMFNDIFEQLKEGNIVTLRYRTPCKDGRLIWVETVSRLCALDDDGVQRCYSSVIDITDTIMEEEKRRSRSLANRYQLAASQWGDILFECDTEHGKIMFSNDYSVMLGREPKEYIEEELEFFHVDDVELVQRALRKIKEGRHCVPIEVRVLTAKGTYLWCSIYFNEPDMIGENPMTVIGKICNIDDEKRERDILLMQSQKDMLTGLLNKSTLEEKIRMVLSVANPWEDYAMFMIDIDDFKAVNDIYGHPFGDAVLKETAQRLKELFAKTDLVGRAGGDEFMAFMKIENEFQARAQGERIMETLCGEYQFDDKEMVLSLSIGVSLSPVDGTVFYDLFRRADSALYHAKAKGKNQCCFFSGG